MRSISINKGWSFGPGQYSVMQMAGRTERTVDLPHDYMIESDVFPEAPAGPASGYFTAGVAHYRKSIMIPAKWEGERVVLRADGIMMNATVEVNGSKAALQHYGYAPFSVDLTPYIYFGQENYILITVNPSMQPNSRWYSGAGIFRGLTLQHVPKLHISDDGIFVYTKELEYDAEGNAVAAYLLAEVDVENHTDKNEIAEITLSLIPEGSPEPVLTRTARIQVNPGKNETAYMAMTLDCPALWDSEHPNLYRAEASVKPYAEYRTHMIPAAEATEDKTDVLFGVREIRWDVRRGLRINGKSVKLRGGCLHHDNGLLGAVSLYDAEVRKLSALKSIGFNAIRTTHNPPSAAFIEACDRLGVYVFDEAFDAWGMGKQPGDYNQYFATDWQKDLTAFVRRDRVHPSVIIWSTGNEITERAGLGNGYTIQTQLATTIKALDPSRPVSNGICSFWNGLDDYMMMDIWKLMKQRESREIQNTDFSGEEDRTWEEYTEAYTNGLDIVGYNYLEHKYAYNHDRWPDRVILGSENFPKEIGLHWPMIEKTPYVIGDFTWTAGDYIGEAGIGKSVFVDPEAGMGALALSSHTSAYPWRLANDADIDITHNILPQGVYRGIVWHNDRTAVFSYDPDTFGKTEILSNWGFTDVRPYWRWDGREGKPVKIAVFAEADEAEVFVNGKSLGRKKAGESEACGMPFTFVFDAVYEPGTVEAVSFRDGKELSRDLIRTHGDPAALRLEPEKACADHENALLYVPVSVLDPDGALVPTGEVPLTAEVSGEGWVLAGFGSGNPVTEENYTKGEAKSFRGRALAVLRKCGESKDAVLTVKAGEGCGIGTVQVTLP
ncbi:MAG: DUF4982 domain-containing protein [Lachnospiraceae bacterium]|nr:DUF4982 domain-containing protein [Lachnospiraceae bacterium]